jgi:hypothetical protein
MVGAVDLRNQTVDIRRIRQCYVEFSTAQENRTWLIAVSYTILRWGLAHFVGLHMK